MSRNYIDSERFGTMAEIKQLANFDRLVIRARTDGEALGQLYEVYYPRVYRFCVHRLFDRGAAEDVTSTVFLQVSGKIRTFKGQTEAEFRNWVYAIAVNHANAYIRKASRRKKLFAKAAASLAIDNDNTDGSEETSWPMLYQAILKLKPKHQTIITLRFFEEMDFEQIGKIVNARSASVRVTLHRIIKELRSHLQTNVDGGI